jgi:cell division protein FtsQ
MTDLATPSSEDLSNRRRTLRKQRRIRNLQAVWRVSAIAGLAAGAAFLLQNPFWLILRTPEQVIVEGNEMLADQTIQDLIALEYPQPLLDIEPEVISEQLQAQAPIAFVQVERRLFPPRLTLTLQERQPVAVTIPSRLNAGTRQDQKTPVNYPGLIDIAGYWMPQDETMMMHPSFQLPALRVRGFRDRYRASWQELYPILQDSAVEVTEVDWRSPNNLILKTALGTVHCGIYDPWRLQEQLKILPRFQDFTTNPNTPAIDVIDLSNPSSPAVKLLQPPPQPEVTP